MRKYVFLFMATCLMGCSDSNENSNNDITEFVTEDSTVQELAIYTIPSPLFAGAALKELNCSYDPAVIDDQRKLKIRGAGKLVTNSLRLGLFISDFGYAFMYNQQADMNLFLTQAENLIRLLDMQSPAVNNMILRLKENLHNRDSVKFLINELQTRISKHYLDNNNNVISIYILTGMLTEGMHLCLNTCSNHDVKTLNYIPKQTGQLLHQFKSFHENIKEMLNSSGVEPDTILLLHLDRLERRMKELDISFSVDRKKNRVRFTYYDKSKISGLRSDVFEFREWIRNGY
jgi:hypothetical protein